MRTTLFTQALMATLACIAAISLSWNTLHAYIQNSVLPKPELQNMGIEHTKPLALRIEYTSKSGAALVNIAHENGEETAYISIPETWERREVRGVHINDVPPEEPSFGFIKWPLPAGSSVQFWVPVAPKNVVVHNPSGASLKIAVLQFDFLRNTVEQNILLIQKDTTTLW